MNDVDDVLEVPVGIGIDHRFKGLLLDARGSYRISYDEDLVSNTDGDGASTLDNFQRLGARRRRVLADRGTGDGGSCTSSSAHPADEGVREARVTAHPVKTSSCELRPATPQRYPRLRSILALAA